MKFIKISLKSVLLLLFISSVGHVNAQNKSKLKLKDKVDSVSYAIGMDLGVNYFKRQSIEVSYDALIQGVIDAMENKEGVLFTDEAKQKILMDFAQELKANQQKVQAVQAVEEKEKGKAFLEENKKKEGVKVTSSGLQYKVITEGTGKSPLATDKVKVHYRGTLIDGTQFDSSYDRGEPITFGLNRVIKGWTEGLQLMKEGGKSILYIPSELGYGDQGGGTIPGGATLIFEVELLQVITE